MEEIVFLDCEGLPATLHLPRFPHEWREYPTLTPDVVVERLQETLLHIEYDQGGWLPLRPPCSGLLFTIADQREGMGAFVEKRMAEIKGE